MRHLKEGFFSVLSSSKTYVKDAVNAAVFNLYASYALKAMKLEDMGIKRRSEHSRSFSVFQALTSFGPIAAYEKYRSEYKGYNLLRPLLSVSSIALFCILPKDVLNSFSQTGIEATNCVPRTG